MKRLAQKCLDDWLLGGNRKPLVVRGARQVGKTWLIRDLAKRHSLNLVELNFERTPGLIKHFSSNNLKNVLRDIEAEFNLKIIPSQSILFLDEIQAAPELLAFLRWFKEDLPELPVIAAGSLLEFVLEEHNFSMPVGRISYFHVEPMSFNEFILASGQEQLYERIINFNVKEPFNEALHRKCMEFYITYCFIGGLPEVVQAWVEKEDHTQCLKIQNDLLATYRDDFNKYREKIPQTLLTRIMDSVVEQLGNKFVFSQVDSSLRSAEVKRALDLLIKARVCHHVQHTSGNGLPLGAEINEKFFKVFPLDIGLTVAQMGISSIRRAEFENMIVANKGGLAELFTALQIRCFQSPFTEPKLYYWQKTGGRQGEVDFIFQHGLRIVPVEVKAGAAGSMKSLHKFMLDKKLDLAVRCDINPFSVNDLSLQTTCGHDVCYKLVSIPHYLTEALPALLERI